jgi:hypothetical protein
MLHVTLDPHLCNISSLQVLFKLASPGCYCSLLCTVYMIRDLHWPAHSSNQIGPEITLHSHRRSRDLRDYLHDFPVKLRPPLLLIFAITYLKFWSMVCPGIDDCVPRDLQSLVNGSAQGDPDQHRTVVVIGDSLEGIREHITYRLTSR